MPSAAGEPRVGVLALQGDFAEHEAALARFGVATVQVRRPEQMRGLAALVLPGGESTTMLRLLRSEGLWEPVAAWLGSGRPVLATCAGLILLAREVNRPRQESLGVLDVSVDRNGYGRQVASGTFTLRSAALPGPTEGVFIRAPRITRVGPSVEVLAWRESDPVLVREGPVLAACFHPELQPEHPVTALFVAQVRARVPASSMSPLIP